MQGHPEEFYSSLASNTGTAWVIIDRAGLDEVIPIWDLIHDELIEGENHSAWQELITNSSNEKTSKPSPSQVNVKTRFVS